MDQTPEQRMELLLKRISREAHAGQAGDVTASAGGVGQTVRGYANPMYLTVHDDPGNMKVRSLSGFHKYGEAYYFDPNSRG